MYNLINKSEKHRGKKNQSQGKEGLSKLGRGAQSRPKNGSFSKVFWGKKSNAPRPDWTGTLYHEKGSETRSF